MGVIVLEGEATLETGASSRKGKLVREYITEVR